MQIRRARVRSPASRFQATTLGKLFTHMCLCHQAVYAPNLHSTGQGAVMPCDWEGNRRSGVALATCHKTSVVYLPTGSQPRLRQGDEHAAYAPHGVWYRPHPSALNVTLPSLLLSAGAPTAVDRYLLPAVRSTASSPAAVAVVRRWDRRTNGRTPDHSTDHALLTVRAALKTTTTSVS